MDELTKSENFIQPDHWDSLNQYTAARIALGRTGVSIPLQESLQFKMAHAHARDAVYASLNKDELIISLQESGHEVVLLHSRAASRQEYLKRPDFGRTLNDDSVDTLTNLQHAENDIVFILADGLSSFAINQHAVPLLRSITPQLKSLSIRIAPVIIVEQGRVAIADEIGSILKSILSVILIGERPGLSSPDSLGVYLTYNPKQGLTDDARNCVSNIRPQGLPYDRASEKVMWLIKEILRRRTSGIDLKEHSSYLLD